MVTLKGINATSQLKRGKPLRRDAANQRRGPCEKRKLITDLLEWAVDITTGACAR